MSSQLLRVTEFCRSFPSLRAEVTVEAATYGPRNSKLEATQCCSVACVTSDLLVQLCCMEGSFAWLSVGSCKVLLRVFLQNGDDCMDDHVYCHQKSRVWVPPIVAKNLGVQQAGPIGIIETTYDVPQKAKHVVLRPWGCPKPRSQVGIKSKSSCPVEWIYPGAQTLVQKSKLLSVYENENGNGRVCYYHVISVYSEAKCGGTLECFITSDATTFQLDESMISCDFDVPDLPCFISQRHFHQFSATEVRRIPHPNLSELIWALDLPATTPPAERILHVVGTDKDHDLTFAIETAAQHAGRTCWSLRGLAAFAHSKGHTVRTGSLVDQLAGLDAAFEEIQRCRMEPCVLNLVDVDLELSTSDVPLRHEQEERIWARITKEVTKSARTLVDVKRLDGAIQCTSCPLIVVLATSTPLKPGPWIKNIVSLSLVLRKPDHQYTRFLWNNRPLDDSTVAILKGRSVREIRRLHQEIGTSMENSEIQLVLPKKCRELDSKRRKVLSATVSQVRWDDVGGLASVREEIMDAIEFPLKYPHLFPNGQGRAGILLYGPPGTGKTLIAKAVATECGLPFLSIKGPELLGSYVGESEANIRNVFQTARNAAEQNTPIAASILFFDELDSLAPKRGGIGDGGGVMERVVATLLAELDGDSSFATKGRVFVMGATNRPDLLDPSMLRPGRLDRTVYLGIAADPEERARILCAQLHKLKLAGDALELSNAVVAKLPSRLTGADFSTIASGAVLQAVERLCRQADAEQALVGLENGRHVELDEILQGWDKNKCTPIVILDDIIEAAKGVTPSVSQAELDRYERLKAQYSGKTSERIEIEGDIFY